MQRIHILGGVLAAAVLAGGGAALGVALAVPPTPATAMSAPTSAAPAAPGIGTAALAPGTALVDGAGRALYLFEADGVTSSCTGACAQVWPPYRAPGALPGTTGAAQGPLVGTTPRADGARQVTYDGHPLYYFAGDTGPGEARGQGVHNFGGGWFVVAPNGDGINPDDAPAARPAPAGAPGSGY
jgi:predicted lipoprotein with Yx(FWY)xxD motif